MTAPLWLAFGRLRNGPAYGADAWCWKLGQRWENLWKDVQGPEPCGSYLRSPSAVLRSIVSWWYASGHARVASSCYFISVHPIPFHHPPPLRQAIMRIYAQREIRSQQEMINHHCCYRPKKMIRPYFWEMGRSSHDINENPNAWATAPASFTRWVFPQADNPVHKPWDRGGCQTCIEKNVENS